jgi:hypothetical protein
MQNLVLNSLNCLKSLETHFKPFQGVQTTFKVILHFADVSTLPLYHCSSLGAFLLILVCGLKVLFCYARTVAYCVSTYS